MTTITIPLFDKPAPAPLAVPVDPSFNAAVRSIAARLWPKGFDVADEAPDTFEKLKAHWAQHRRLLVWKGASEHTIFACPETNWAFRAWHDWCHLTQDLPFTPEGEYAASRVQMSHLAKVYGDSDAVRRWCALIDAEVVGQAEHFKAHGVFPEDQVAFDQWWATHAHAVS